MIFKQELEDLPLGSMLLYRESRSDSWLPVVLLEQGVDRKGNCWRLRLYHPVVGSFYSLILSYDRLLSGDYCEKRLLMPDDVGTNMDSWY